MTNEYYHLADDDRFPMGPLRIDLSELYHRLPPKKLPGARVNYIPQFADRFHRYFYRMPFLPIRYRSYWKALLRNTGIDNNWLHHFQRYWGHLGGRSLWHPADFFSYAISIESGSRRWRKIRSDPMKATWQLGKDPNSSILFFTRFSSKRSHPRLKSCSSLAPGAENFLLFWSTDAALRTSPVPSSSID